VRVSSSEGKREGEGQGQGVREGLPAIIMVWSATSWQGKFEPLGNLTRSNSRGQPQWSWVDPTIWADQRGHLHILANMGWQNGPGERSDIPSVGAHAYSYDGRTWHSPCFEPGNVGSGCAPWVAYNGTTVFADGTTKLLQFERAKMVLDPKSGAPLALFNSVGRHGPMVIDGDDSSWTIARPIRQQRLYR
jgi:hypothetical protein